jgi:hypothetical protein
VHRSKLAVGLVDVPASVFDREVTFWSGVLGREPDDVGDHPEFRDFGQPVPGFQFLLQRVDDASRVHFDIETDDIEAEVRRLEALGAERVRQVHAWWVMRDPAGLLFCVVRVQTGALFDEHATTWE